MHCRAVHASLGDELELQLKIMTLFNETVSDLLLSPYYFQNLFKFVHLFLQPVIRSFITSYRLAISTVIFPFEYRASTQHSLLIKIINGYGNLVKQNFIQFL